MALKPDIRNEPDLKVLASTEKMNFRILVDQIKKGLMSIASPYDSIIIFLLKILIWDKTRAEKIDQY